MRAVSTRISPPTSRRNCTSPRGVDVAAHGVGDVGVEVVLGGAGLEVPGRLLAVDGPPGEDGTRVAEGGGALTGLVEHRVAEPEQVAGDPRLGVGEERQHVHLAVPEVVAVVPPAAEPLGGNPGPLRAPGRLGQLEQVPADGLLERDGVVSGRDLHVGPVPERVEVLPLGPAQPLVAALHDPVERPVAATDQLRGRHAAGGLVGHELVDPDGFTGTGLGGDGEGRQVVVDLHVDVVQAGGLHDVVDAHPERHLRVRRLVAERDAGARRLGQTPLEHPVAEDPPQPRIGDGAGRHLVLGRRVLPVEDLGVDHDRGVVVDGDLVADRGDVAVLERHEPLGAHVDVLAGRGRPQDVPAQRAGPHVQDPLVAGEACRGQVERLVVDVELQDGGVGDVDEGLAEARQAVGLLGVDDRPRLVEAAHERPGRRRPAAPPRGCPAGRGSRWPGRTGSRCGRGSPR